MAASVPPLAGRVVALKTKASSFEVRNKQVSLIQPLGFSPNFGERRRRRQGACRAGDCSGDSGALQIAGACFRRAVSLSPAPHGSPSVFFQRPACDPRQGTAVDQLLSKQRLRAAGGPTCWAGAGGWDGTGHFEHRDAAAAEEPGGQRD